LTGAPLQTPRLDLRKGSDREGRGRKRPKGRGRKEEEQGKRRISGGVDRERAWPDL